jgi:hypothetical protein
VEMTLEQLRAWLERYFKAWISNDPDEVSALFSDGAIYYYGPFKEPARGRKSIVENWVSNPEGQQDVNASFEALAVNGDQGIAHWNVRSRIHSSENKKSEMDGILLLRFNPRMECTEHREWYTCREIES